MSETTNAVRATVADLRAQFSKVPDGPTFQSTLAVALDLLTDWQQTLAPLTSGRAYWAICDLNARLRPFRNKPFTTADCDLVAAFLAIAANQLEGVEERP